MIELSKPLNPGDVHPGVLYTHARMRFCNMDLLKLRIRASVYYVYLAEDGTWQDGIVPSLEVLIDGPDFHTAKKLKAKMPNGDILREWTKALEQFLVDEGLISGRVIDDDLLNDPPPLLEGQTPMPSLKKRTDMTLGYHKPPEQRAKEAAEAKVAKVAERQAEHAVKAAAAKPPPKASRKKAPAPQ